MGSSGTGVVCDKQSLVPGVPDTQRVTTGERGLSVTCPREDRLLFFCGTFNSSIFTTATTSFPLLHLGNPKQGLRAPATLTLLSTSVVHSVYRVLLWFLFCFCGERNGLLFRCSELTSRKTVDSHKWGSLCRRERGRPFCPEGRWGGAEGRGRPPKKSRRSVCLSSVHCLVPELSRVRSESTPSGEV